MTRFLARDRLLAIALSIAGVAVASAPARAQCAAWNPAVGAPGTMSTVYAFTVFDDGTGPALYAGGSFLTAGGVSAKRVAKWNGSSWSGLGTGTDGDVYALAVYDDGSGPALFAGGAFTTAGGVGANRIAKWQASSWSALAGGVDDTVRALCFFDDGSGGALYAGGEFLNANGASASRIARWNGVGWSSLGIGMNSTVFAVTAFDDGSGAALCAGGTFNTAGGVISNRIAKWNGASWSPFGSGVNSSVFALAAYDDGAGSALYAGGLFNMSGASVVSRVARWTGSSWLALGSGVNNTVRSLTMFTDAFGPSLVAGGDFTIAGGNAASRVARWNGAGWSSFGGGVDDTVEALATFDDGVDGALDLYAGGEFTVADGQAAAHVAEWLGCAPGIGYCFGDGLDTVLTAACPCGNIGFPGRGCGNSNPALGGARLTASGSTSPNTIVLACTGLLNASLCTFLRGTLDDANGVVFGDGVKCVTGTVQRFGQQNAGQGDTPSNTAITTTLTVPPGNTRYYQCHYRNASAGFCPPEPFNISNGYRVTW